MTAKKSAYVPFLVAKQLLVDRLTASPEEIAAWIFLGPKLGGLAAYEHANEKKKPPRFYFDYLMGTDYLPQLVRCWFKKEQVERFAPRDRFITGQQLVDRWSNSVDHVNQFIEEMIAERKLLDLHPTFGGTQWTEGDEYPPRASALFEVAQIVAIEHENGMSNLGPLPALATTVTSDKSRPTKAHTPTGAPMPPNEDEVEITKNWKLLVQQEAARRWTALQAGGASPTKNSIKTDLSNWCRDNEIRTSTGVIPSESYIYRHALRNWNPPRSRQKRLGQVGQVGQVGQRRLGKN